MDDDFSTPKAVAILFELSHLANNVLSQKDPNLEAIIDAENLFSKLGGDILGIIPDDSSTFENDVANLNDIMEILIELRKEFRMNKDFKNADLIRTRLNGIGIEIKDSPEGTVWEKNKK